MVAKKPARLRLDTIIGIHQSQIAEHGGMQGIRDMSLLKAAVARPQQIYAYETPLPGLPRLAAAYGYGIIQNHPFVDGNKRTGLVCLGIFLELNGQRLVGSAVDIFSTIVATASGTLTEDHLVAWVERQSK